MTEQPATIFQLGEVGQKKVLLSALTAESDSAQRVIGSFRAYPVLNVYLFPNQFFFCFSFFAHRAHIAYSYYMHMLLLVFTKSLCVCLIAQCDLLLYKNTLPSSSVSLFGLILFFQIDFLTTSGGCFEFSHNPKARE